MEELKENDLLNFDDEKYIIFDDRELDELEGEEGEPIEIDEEFQKQVSKELDEFLKKHPLQYEE